MSNAGVAMPEPDVNRSAATRRRNVYFAMAIIFTALSLAFAFDFDGHVLILWRDAPAVAFLFAVAAVFFAVRWRRTPRS
jgi:hypothetical protein